MRSSRSGTDPLDPGPKGFAHRGLHYGSGFPENSLIAFAAALEFGAGIECDLRLTKDDRVLVFHDADAWRMCSSPLVIGKSTHAELKRLKVGEGPIPTLESLLKLVDGRVPLLLEVKVENDIWRWMPAFRQALKDYRGPYGIMSFDPRVPRLLKTNLPEVRRGLVIRERLPAVKRRVALWLADPHFIAVERTALTSAWVAGARQRMPVYSWTIKDSRQRAQAQVHADSLIWEADGRP
jgi:glycerophosphoryl diester phosphodiesterase